MPQATDRLAQVYWLNQARVAEQSLIANPQDSLRGSR